MSVPIANNLLPLLWEKLAAHLCRRVRILSVRQDIAGLFRQGVVSRKRLEPVFKI